MILLLRSSGGGGGGAGGWGAVLLVLGSVATTDGTAALTGVVGTTALGSETHSITRALTGVEATASRGSLSASGGTIVEPALGQIGYSFRIDMEETPGTWVSFGDDVLLRDSIRWKRGNSRNTPFDTVAVTGDMQWSLRNDDGCSGGRGYYSPNSGNVRAGFGFGTWVRIVFTVDGTDYVRWTGKLRVINPLSGRNGPQSTLCIAHDSMGDIAESDIRELSPMFNQTEDVLLDAVLDSLPTDSQPRARILDPGLDTIPVAFHDLGSGTKGLSVWERVVSGSRGRSFVTGDGTMRYINRDLLAVQAPVYAFEDYEAAIEVPSNLENVYNRVRLVGHPVELGTSIIVLGAHSGTLEIQAGETQELWLTYNDPTNPSEKIGGFDFEDPVVATTDYVWNALADGTGADLTGSVTVTADFFITTVKLTITNNALVPAFKQLLQVRGKGIFDYDPITAESYTPRAYGNRPIEIDLPYQGDIAVLKQQAAFIDATYRDLADQITRVRFVPQTAEALMLLAMTVEVCDVVEASDPQSLPGGTLTFINAVSMEIDQDGFMVIVLDTGPWIIQSETESDTLSFTDALTPTSAAPESRVDFALVGFSEVA